MTFSFHADDMSAVYLSFFSVIGPVLEESPSALFQLAGKQQNSAARNRRCRSLMASVQSHLMQSRQLLLSDILCNIIESKVVSPAPAALYLQCYQKEPLRVNSSGIQADCWE